MVTYFNRKDLVSFGNYLLSDERRKMIENHPFDKNDAEMFIQERIKSVHHADIENWKESLKKEE